jgi:hypothetical protein
MKSLYAYFGLLELHGVDSPGHSLYQLGLIDSLRESFGESSFDFYSYYPQEIVKEAILNSPEYPESSLGKLFEEYHSKLFSQYCVSLTSVIENIENKEYSKIYLKARFRNLSSLAKKWKDARDFEKIIETAISSGYLPHQIVILDTDLSLPENFFKKYSGSVTCLVPSIDFPGISVDFLNKCVAINLTEFSKSKNIVYYGNIDTSNYKSGNAKSPILKECIDFLESGESPMSSSIICKKGDFSFSKIQHIPRNSRLLIWKELSKSLVMLNVTKEKYNAEQFIPARVFEAMIFGMIPVSYKFEFLNKSFSFNTVEDLSEIIKYLDECSNEDLKAAYSNFIESYLKHTDK